MHKFFVFLTILIPALASAGKIDLRQDLGGLDLAVTMVPANNPDAIRIANKTAKPVVCSGSFTGADAGGTSVVTIKPGKAGTIRVPGSYTDLPRSAELKCSEKPPAKK
jgi:hypothetical protein